MSCDNHNEKVKQNFMSIDEGNIYSKFTAPRNSMEIPIEKGIPPTFHKELYIWYVVGISVLLDQKSNLVCMKATSVIRWTWIIYSDGLVCYSPYVT